LVLEGVEVWTQGRSHKYTANFENQGKKIGRENIKLILV